MLIAVDIGNARASCGLFEGARLRRAWSVPAEAGPDARQLAAGARGARVEAVVASCVVPAAAARFRTALRSALGVAPWFVKVGDVPMRVAGYDRGQLGVDRLLAAAAAYERYGRALIVVDAGTAITVDFVAKRGEFAGGAILPGIDTSARALKGVAAQLPYVKPAPTKRIVAKNTKDAIRAGLFHGYAGLVEHIVKRISREARARPIVVATGGDADLIARACPSIARVHPHLVLEGLRLTWERCRALK